MKSTKIFTGSILALLVAFSFTGLAQNGPGQPSTVKTSANEQTIKAFYTTFERKDWAAMQQLLAAGFTFTSPLDDHINTQQFKDQCWPNSEKIKKFEIEQLFVDGDRAFVVYNGWTNDGKLFRNSDAFTFKEGKVLSEECFFGKGINYPNSGK
jgi:ketosteroid isomerase-like protein